MNLKVLNEYGCLKDVILSRPNYFRVIKPINAIQAHFFSSDPPRLENMISEFLTFEKVLSGRGCNIHYLTNLHNCPYQVWTRDVAFCYDNSFFLSNMSAELRQPERRAVQDWTINNEIRVNEFFNGAIEGGDILCDTNRVFVGLSKRTDINGIQELRNKLSSSVEVITIQLADWVLHLDMVLNLVPGGAVWCPDGFKDTTYLRSLFDGKVFKVSVSDSNELATNFLFLDPETVISQSRHQKLNKWFRKNKFNVIELSFTELNKLGGGFRCATLPIKREV